MADTETPGHGFKYHLELSPAQLKITHTALRSLLDDFGHEEADVQDIIRSVLEKLPDEHAMRAIRLETELEREARGEAPAIADLDDDLSGAEPPEPPDTVA